jgi:CO/xanthine dehydrogenase FAD-binding subunit
MYAAPFEYVRATSWQEAVQALAEGGEDARVLAGGQSLIPMMTMRLAEPSVLVDVGGAAERTIERSDGALVLSALVRHVDIERSDAVAEACSVLAEGAHHIGNVRVRHRGTIGGSMAHGDATSELGCIAVALGATVRTLRSDGPRAIPADELFISHFTTALDPGEVITHVEFPALRAGQGAAFLELSPGHFGSVEVTALVEQEPSGRCADVRVAVGATADRPVDLSAAAAPASEWIDERTAAAAGRAVADAVDVGESLHGSAAYRREMVAVLTKRALLTAAARAQGGERR